MELWDLYDLDRNKTGKTMIRGEKQPADTYRIIVHVCIFNTKGEMLIQKRQPFKEGWSDLWDISVGGSAISNDDSRTAAHRELKEELGLDLDFSNKRPALTVHFPIGFDDIYLFDDMDIDLAKLILQKEEVEKVLWASEEEIINLIKEKKFIPYNIDFIRLLFYYRKRNDSLTTGDWTRNYSKK